MQKLSGLWTSKDVCIILSKTCMKKQQEPPPKQQQQNNNKKNTTSKQKQHPSPPGNDNFSTHLSCFVNIEPTLLSDKQPQEQRYDFVSLICFTMNKVTWSCTFTDHARSATI